MKDGHKGGRKKGQGSERDSDAGGDVEVITGGSSQVWSAGKGGAGNSARPLFEIQKGREDGGETFGDFFGCASFAF
jgi:hypothetical protein